VTICHEFNNPLAAIKISTDIIRRQSEVARDQDILSELDQQMGEVEQKINRLRDIGGESPAGGP
jgi:signal transduction histidine kinase